MKYNGVILKKFSVMDNEVARLRALENVTTELLDSNHFLKHGIERSLQICIEVIIDVSQRILSLEGQLPAATAFDALKGIEALGVIEKAERYRHMVQFRNFVVHRYEQVESEILVVILQKHLEDLSGFRNEVAGAT